MNWFERGWYKQHSATWLLLPLTLIFTVLSAVRRLLFKLGLKKKTKLPVPVVIVGNITVGGTGKTPFVIWLARYLQAIGLQPGIISRGFGGQIKSGCHCVAPNDSASLVGDETRLIANNLNLPVMVGRDRALCGEKLASDYGCNIIISDDGLQHYKLARDIEIILIDGHRQLGNQALLPAGPLREGKWRLNTTPLVIQNGRPDNLTLTPYYFSVKAAGFKPILQMGNEDVGLITQKFNKKIGSYAVCAIGNPQRFYHTLQEQGVKILEYHSFIDHHNFTSEDFDVCNGAQIVMTEKDAVKCREFAQANWWYLPIEITPDSKFQAKLAEIIDKTRKQYGI
ncbi:tetraacyldisaccharide 4'-kinase [Catenovulum sediminis]|uniref:tetraacyldisaccharide 4'-kinase n=1 Tax=Catenovulum sediminis TaxID=1740262 RepID=UPI00117D3FE2|nr:tetraacyldisaccharide 4'-kinase [Catenovulum sediminis]